MKNVHDIRQKTRFCVIIPVYNSENFISDTINSVLQYAENIIIINDGSTDGTADVIIQHYGFDLQSREVIENCKCQKNANIIVISYSKNRGKGYALQQGFKKALELGFTHVVTMDADGQHLANDIALLTERTQKNPDALIVGSRKFDNPNMLKGSRFANNFSNFWFRMQTGISLPDTQTGFRLYPLHRMGNMRLFTNRYETELELLVRLAWRGIKIIPQEINVYYPPENERLSHFRKGIDFFRISVLNTVLCVFAVVYGYPSMFLRKIFKT
ncbi:MAG: glycosyltransferase family 2 protein [Prevotellaceae bacterium]|jgi:glycosyltransferase involved in cell wall biosynthesis|nr:glycosyltransferase family 2 protein [Prevotellaceae bacterium]